MAGGKPPRGAGGGLTGAAAFGGAPAVGTAPEAGTGPAVEASEVATPIVLVPALVEQLLAHARREAPRECCGILSLAPAAADGRGARLAAGPVTGRTRAGRSAPLRYHPARNRAASLSRYELDPEDLLSVLSGLEEERGALWGFAHSHVGQPAIPSAVDIDNAWYPDAVWLILSLAPGGEAGLGLRLARGETLRAYRIVGGLPTALLAAPTAAGAAEVPLRLATAVCLS